MAKRFKISLSLQGTDTSFQEGWGPGEVARRVITVNQPLTEDDMRSSRWANTISEQKSKLIEEQFKWTVEQLDDE